MQPTTPATARAWFAVSMCGVRFFKKSFCSVLSVLKLRRKAAKNLLYFSRSLSPYVSISIKRASRSNFLSLAAAALGRFRIRTLPMGGRYI